VEVEAEARDIIARLTKNPAAFAKLAMEKSKDQGSKAKGGELGCSIRPEWSPSWCAVTKLEKGKVHEARSEHNSAIT